MGDMLDLIDQHIAYAWSEDGKDRFTRVKPNENLWVQSNSIAGFVSPFSDNTKGEVLANTSNHQSMTTLIDVGNNSTIYYKVYNPNKISNSSNTNVLAFFDANNVCIGVSENMPKLDGSITQESKIPVPNGVSKVRLGYIAGVAGGNFDSSVKVKFEFGNEPTIYTTPPQDDYDNAVPRYIGRSLKDSNDPSDYKWEPNPERKPWTVYAQGLNGEGLSLVPYGENLIKNSSGSSPIFMGTVGNSTQTIVNNTIKIETTGSTNSGQYLLKSWTTTPLSVGDIVILSFEAKVEKGVFNIFGVLEYADTISFNSEKMSDNWFRYIRITKNTGTSGAITFYSSVPSIVYIRKVKLELANTMGIPTPWTPAKSEDPLGAIPKYVGTAALPYEDWTKYEWDLNPSWLQQESNNNLANKVDNDTYNNERSNVWTEISNRVTKEEAQAIQKSLDKVTGAYTDFVSTGGKHDQDLANLKRAINTDIQKLADKVLGFDFVNTWFRIGDGGLSIGEANSNFEILVSNDQITFYDSGTAVAYVSNQSFFINSGMIVDDLQIGKFKFAKVNDNLMGLFHIA